MQVNTLLGYAASDFTGNRERSMGYLKTREKLQTQNRISVLNYQRSFCPGRQSDKQFVEFVGEIRRSNSSTVLFRAKIQNSFQSYPSVVLFRFRTASNPSSVRGLR